MSRKRNNISINKNMVGIIPLFGNALNLSFDWPDYMLPLDDGFTLLDNAILQQSALGVSAIFLICDSSVTPLTRKMGRENVVDPHSISTVYYKLNARLIPIYYVNLPTAQRVNGLNNSNLWAIYYATRLINSIYSRFTNYAIPNRFLISDPYCIFPVLQYTLDQDGRYKRSYWTQLRSRLKNGRSRSTVQKPGLNGQGIRHVRLDPEKINKLVLFGHNGKTILDGVNLPFVINQSIVEKMRNYIYNDTSYLKYISWSTDIKMPFNDFMLTVKDEYKRSFIYEVNHCHELTCFNDYIEHMAFRSEHIHDDDKERYIDYKTKLFKRSGKDGIIEWDDDEEGTNAELVKEIDNIAKQGV